MILQIVPKVEVVRKDKLMMYDNFDILRSSAMAIAMALRNDGDDGKYQSSMRIFDHGNSRRE